MGEIQQRAPLSAEDVLYEAARVACLAPSIEDSQPWLWRIRGDALELRADRSRQLVGTDPEGRLMVISCGAVLHHATVVLAVLGVAAGVERPEDPADPDLLARLTLTGAHQVTAEEMRLHHALRTRCTDRRPFLGIAPLPEEVMALLREAAAPFAVGMRVLEPPTPAATSPPLPPWPPPGRHTGCRRAGTSRRRRPPCRRSRGPARSATRGRARTGSPPTWRSRRRATPGRTGCAPVRRSARSCWPPPRSGWRRRS